MHSTGLLSQRKKRYRDEMSRLMEQEHQLLKQENERLQAEMLNIKDDLVHSREKVIEILKSAPVLLTFSFFPLLMNYKPFSILTAGHSAR